ncbi:hypothetical protein HK100_011888 [Physocladia obscura]|uniref:G-protein coupled receptors family 2 profile 1 domain-containing protein n=1 Tax=Physocladia obscura TaxID=109957 RepID=A0AAD5T343_9FUNG|nr:hypothetical protein HK100_011888 [Physocladia obscura]
MVDNGTLSILQFPVGACNTALQTQLVGCNSWEMQMWQDTDVFLPSISNWTSFCSSNSPCRTSVKQWISSVSSSCASTVVVGATPISAFINRIKMSLNIPCITDVSGNLCAASYPGFPDLTNFTQPDFMNLSSSALCSQCSLAYMYQLSTADDTGTNMLSAASLTLSRNSLSCGVNNVENFVAKFVRILNVGRTLLGTRLADLDCVVLLLEHVALRQKNAALLFQAGLGPDVFTDMALATAQLRQTLSCFTPAPGLNFTGGCQQGFGNCNPAVDPTHVCGIYSANHTSCPSGQCCGVNGQCGTNIDSCATGFCQTGFGVCGRSFDPTAVCGSTSQNLTSCNSTSCCSANGQCLKTADACSSAACQGDYGACTWPIVPSCPGSQSNQTLGVVLPNTIGNTVTIGNCPMGFVGTVSAECLSDGTWGFVDQSNCTFGSWPDPVVCPQDNGFNATTSPNLAAAPCTNNGAPAMASKLRYCTDQGWGPIDSTSCTNSTALVTCSAANNFPITVAGLSASAPCPIGKTGMQTATCSSSGVWSALNSTGCVSMLFKATCPASNVTGLPSGTVGNNITVPCAAGSSGQVVAICSATGIWETDSTGCVGIVCAAANGFGATPIGQNGTKPCTPPLAGNILAFCSNNSTWGQPDSSGCYTPASNTTITSIATTTITIPATSSSSSTATSGISTSRCGLSWADANGKCGITCQDNGPCTASGQQCYAALSTSPCSGSNTTLTTTTSTTTTTTTKTTTTTTTTTATVTTTSGYPTSRCGLSWADANGKCGIACQDNGPCTASSQQCYAALSTTPCSGSNTTLTTITTTTTTTTATTATITATVATTSGYPTSRCGLSWADANGKCGTACQDNGPCTASGQACYAALSTSPCSNRCGLTWADANGKCGTSCVDLTDASCPTGQHCYGSLAVVSC